MECRQEFLHREKSMDHRDCARAEGIEHLAGRSVVRGAILRPKNNTINIFSDQKNMKLSPL